MQDFTYGKLMLREEGEGPKCLDSMNGFHNTVVEMGDCRGETSGPEDEQVVRTR